jgi:hypothetical protein
MGEVAAGGGDGAAGVEVNPFGKNAEGFAERHGGKMRLLRLRGRAPEKRATDRRDHSAQNDNSSNVSAGFYAL